MEKPLTRDQDDPGSPQPTIMSDRKGNSDKAQKVFHCIDNQQVEELRDLCNKWSVLKLTLNKPPAETPLHRATKKGFVDCLKVLLDTKTDMEDLEAPDDKGQTALLTAVVNAQPEALKCLLDARANVNARDDKHQGALHLLVQELTKGSRDKDCLMKVANELLSSSPDLEPHATMNNLSNATPLALAADKLQQGNDHLLDLCKRLVTAGASLLEKVHNITIKQVFTRKKCLQKELEHNWPSPQRPMVAHVIDLIAMHKSTDDVVKVLQGDKNSVYKAVNSRLGSHSLLYHAVGSNNTSLVRALLENGAKPWKAEGTLELPLHHAIKKNNEEIFKLFVDHMKKKEKYLYLGDHSASIFKLCVISLKEGDMTCFRHLLQECDPKIVGASLNQDAMNESLLPILVYYLKNVSKTDYEDILGLVLPTTLERAMDNCITLPDEGDTLQLDYRFLLPQHDFECVNELELPMSWCYNQQHYQAIKHPLMQTLLTTKRQKALPLYLIYIICFFVFTVLLTGLSSYRSYIDKGWIFMFILMVVELCQCCHLWDIGQGCIYFRQGCMHLRQIRMFFKQGCRHFRGASKIILMVFLLILALIRDELIIWSIVFVWYDLVMILGRFPPLHKYATALHIVTKTFIVLIFVYGGLIAAFACSFSIMLTPTGNKNISDFGNLLANTLVMSFGEFEYSDLSKELQGISAKLAFIGFLFFIVLVVMNVMNSLAVADIEESVRKAELKRIKAQLETLYTLERFCIAVSCLCCKLNCIRVFKDENQLDQDQENHNLSSLQAKISLSDNFQRLQTKTGSKILGTLDDDTMTCLRNYRTQKIQHKQLGIAAKDLITQHPEVVKTLAAALCSRQVE